MENAVTIGIALVIIYQGYKLIQNQRKLKKELKNMKSDFNVEFGSGQGEGIELVKKQYPELNLRDDHRTGIEEIKGHSISNGMNDPSERQEAKFIVENKNAI